MEWVETTGRTVEEAKDAALDQLGIDAQDAEFEVLAEPKSGLFGRLRVEARVRARVRPTTPRAKEERRDRKRRPRDGERQERRPSTSGGGGGGGERGPRGGGGGRGNRGDRGDAAVATAPRRRRPAAAADNGQVEAREVPEMSLAEQAEVGREFLQGLVTQFSPAATVAVEPVDDDTIRLAVSGGELGLLIGPKGQTLQSLQELVRTVVQRHTASREGWLVVDVSEYRVKRKAALERFSASVAEQVIQTGQSTTLEPMSAADRKIVHDAINDIDGVSTRSEGEDPRRAVVIMPGAGD